MKEGSDQQSAISHQLKMFIEEHGYEAVTEALMQILEKHFRRQDLAKAAERLNLIPPTVGRLERHTAEAVRPNNN